MSRACLIAILALAGCTSEDWDPMEDQPKPLPYKPSSEFADGRSMRPLPAGAVPIEAPHGEQLRIEGTLDGGLIFAAERPPLTLQSLETGHHDFDIYCAACHGVRGNGQSVVASKMALRPPPSLLAQQVRALDDAQLYVVLSQGYGMMPSLAAWITPADRWRVIDYLRALQLSADAPADRLDPQDLAQLAKEAP